MISNLIASRFMPDAKPFDNLTIQRGITYFSELSKGSKFIFRIENKRI